MRIAHSYRPSAILSKVEGYEHSFEMRGLRGIEINPAESAKPGSEPRFIFDGQACITAHSEAIPVQSPHLGSYGADLWSIVLVAEPLM